MTVSTLHWQAACEALWGPEWIVPLADVLDVNRRTVERWKAHDTIPEHIAADLVRLGGDGAVTSAYGRLLRRIALGASLDDIEADLANQQMALEKFRADAGHYSAIAVLQHDWAAK